MGPDWKWATCRPGVMRHVKMFSLVTLEEFVLIISQSKSNYYNVISHIFQWQKSLFFYEMMWVTKTKRSKKKNFTLC